MLEVKVARHDAEKDALMKKIDLRTQRHQAEQNKNLSFEQKETIERRVRKSEAELTIVKDEQGILTKRNSSLAEELLDERN